MNGNASEAEDQNSKMNKKEKDNEGDESGNEDDKTIGEYLVL